MLPSVVGKNRRSAPENYVVLPLSTRFSAGPDRNTASERKCYPCRLTPEHWHTWQEVLRGPCSADSIETLDASSVSTLLSLARMKSDRRAFRRLARVTDHQLRVTN